MPSKCNSNNTHCLTPGTDGSYGSILVRVAQVVTFVTPTDLLRGPNSCYGSIGSKPEYFVIAVDDDGTTTARCNLNNQVLLI